jgi:hypothetical protein
MITKVCLIQSIGAGEWVFYYHRCACRSKGCVRRVGREKAQIAPPVRAHTADDDKRLPATLLCAQKWGEREARALTLRRCCQRRFSASRAFLITTAGARVDLSDAERIHLARSFASIGRNRAIPSLAYWIYVWHTAFFFCAFSGCYTKALRVSFILEIN